MRTPPRRVRSRHARPATALFGGLFGGAKQRAPTAEPQAPATPPPPPPPVVAAPPPPAPPTLPADEDGAAPLPVEEDVTLAETTDPADGAPVTIVYTTRRALAPPSAIGDLCLAVGWPARPPASLQRALDGSYLVAALVARRSGEEEGGTLVGLARATSDRAFNATIWDVLVHPAYQGRGLGRALVERVTGALLAAGIANVTLFADGQALPFYEALGYEADPEGIRGMFYAGK